MVQFKDTVMLIKKQGSRLNSWILLRKGDRIDFAGGQGLMGMRQGKIRWGREKQRKMGRDD